MAKMRNKRNKAAYKGLRRYKQRKTQDAVVNAFITGFEQMGKTITEVFKQLSRSLAMKLTVAIKQDKILDEVD